MLIYRIFKICTIIILYASNLSSYEVASEKYSYFLLNDKGNLVHSNGLPISDDRAYSIPVKIDPSRTAIVVMDPWIDMASEFLNEYYGKITKSRLLPLIYRARNTGHQIIILTNDPSKVHYNTEIDRELLAMVDDCQVHLIYHQSRNTSSFANFLKERNINTLIYTGYASNICIIGRSMGMIQMKNYGFRLFFVPEASAAVETAASWENGAIHDTTTVMISQWIGNLIHWTDHIESMSLD